MFRLSEAIDRWIAHTHGYTRLRSRWLSKGCQTMLDLPRRPNFSEKAVQYDRDIADYIAYLNRPVINVNDNYIEVHQYHYDLPEAPVRPPTRRKRHRVAWTDAETVRHRRATCPQYSPERNKNNRVARSNTRPYLQGEDNTLRINNGQENAHILTADTHSGREENKNMGSGRLRDLNNGTTKRVEQDGKSCDQESMNHDAHRPLVQATKVADSRLDVVLNRTGHAKVKRGQTISSKCETQGPEPSRGFLSFRSKKKVPSKKVVVNEAGVTGPVWPAVLLTFDRSISPEFLDVSII